MRINAQKNIQFKGFGTKLALRSLEKISEYPATFNTMLTFVSAVALRPFAIKLAPKVERENKEYAISNSIGSAFAKLAIAEMIALPIERAVKNIDKCPQKFLKPETIKQLQGSAKFLNQSESYRFLMQAVKLSANLITAIPKAIIAVPLLVMLKDKIFPDESPKVIKPKRISFKGRVDNTLAKGIGKILDISYVQKFAQKCEKYSKDVCKYMIMLTDTLLCGAFSYFTAKNKNIDENRKKPLILNNVISTAISIAGGFSIDKLIQKNTDKYVENFVKTHSANPKVVKYVQGINILRPALIFAGIYYGIIPVVSTFLAERLDKSTSKKPNC